MGGCALLGLAQLLRETPDELRVLCLLVLQNPDHLDQVLHVRDVAVLQGQVTGGAPSVRYDTKQAFEVFSEIPQNIFSAFL